MNEPERRRPSVDGDGVRITKAARRPFTRVELASAAALMIGVALCVTQLRRDAARAEDMPAPNASDSPASQNRDVPRPAAKDEPAGSESAKAQQEEAAPVRRTVRPRRATAGRQQPAGDDAAPARKNQPTDGDAKEYIEALRAAGETGGIAAFPPPGTNPVKSGLVVPDDYALPEGYVRHYQTTDNGEQLAAILMFSPDYEFLDENGHPVPIPEDGIVPPEMAPPDLPLHPLKLPKGAR